MTFDAIIKGGRWFDGTGAASAVRNLGIRDGRVAVVTTDDLDETGCPEVVDAAGKWVLPGLRRHPHALRHRGARRPGPARSRCGTA